MYPDVVLVLYFYTLMILIIGMCSVFVKLLCVSHLVSFKIKLNEAVVNDPSILILFTVSKYLNCSLLKKKTFKISFFLMHLYFIIHCLTQLQNF